MDEDIIAILIEKQELENDYTPKRKEVSFFHHQSNSNSTPLRTSTCSSMEELRWSENSGGC